MADERTRIVAGCMTGTSLDGLDAALVRITGTGLAMKADLLGHHAVDLPGALRETLMSLASGEANEPIAYLRAARALGELHAAALADLFAEYPNDKPDFVTAHGQTIWHAPRDGDDELGGGPKSWQLFDPWPIVRRLKLPVCYDLRQADLIAGGEGAPLTPIADWVMYRNDRCKRVVVNLGGVCNATVLPDSESDFLITAFDLGPCNLLLDGMVQQLFPGKRYDKDGDISGQGGLWEDFSHNCVDAKKQTWPRSLGREDYNKEWIEGLIAIGRHGFEHGTPSDEDMVTSAVFAIADYIVGEFVRSVSGDLELILAGGGARNPNLLDSIKWACSSSATDMLISDDLGIPCEAREAMGFAVLGALSRDGIPISLPQVTGASDPGVAGVWAYPNTAH